MFKISDLRHKEVINMSDGERLGFVFDMEIDSITGHINTIIVPGKQKQKIFGKNNGVRIPWASISKIGDDLIVVNRTDKE